MKNIHIVKEEEFMRRERNGIQSVTPKFNKWFESFMEGKNKSLKIVDLGCGNGNVLKLLKGMGFRNLTGVELSEGMIRHSMAYAKIKRHDLESPLPFPGGSFDLAIAKDICEHIINIEQFISEASRILKPGGVLVIGGPNLKSIYHRLRILMGNTEHISINFGIAHMRWVSYDIFRRWLGPYFTFKPVIFEWYARATPNLLARSCNIICVKKTHTGN